MDFERMKKLAGLDYITTEPKVLVEVAIESEVVITETEIPEVADEFDAYIALSESEQLLAHEEGRVRYEEIVTEADGKVTYTAGRPYLVEASVVDVVELTEKLGSDDKDEDSDDEGSHEGKVKKLTARYRRGNASRSNPDVDKEAVKKDQDDAFQALSGLLGGASKAAKHLMSEGIEVVEPKEEATVEEPKAEKVVKLRVPADVLAVTNQRISELKKAIEEFDEKGVNDVSVKQNAIDALEQILADFKKPDAKVIVALFYGSLMSPITTLFPPKLVKFIHAK